MIHERPSTDDGTERLDSGYDESERDAKRTRDERELYGEPCHEVEAKCDEQTLYGKPQHDTDEDPETPDPDLLFARMRSASFAGPTASTPRESTAGTTER